MATNKFDSGHVIVPVMHPSGDVHHIAVPEDTDMIDLHAALGEAGYHQDLPQPTREGAIEFSPAFRGAAEKAVMASHNFTGQEAGFSLDKNLAPHRGRDKRPIIQTAETASGKGHGLNLITQPDDAATFHTHPSGSPRPSAKDEDDARSRSLTMYVASPDGLWAVGPDGRSQRIFSSRTWYSDKEPK